MDDMNPAVKRCDADAGGEAEEAADEQQRPLGRRAVPELVVIPRRRRRLPLPLRRLVDHDGAVELLVVLVLATRRPGSARGDAALEVAQEAAHAPGAAAGEPRGGGDGGLVRLDVGVLVPRRPARRGAGRRRGAGGVGSEERGVVVVAGGHGGVRRPSGVRGVAAAASRSGGGRGREGERGRQSGEVDECEGGLSVRE